MVLIYGRNRITKKFVHGGTVGSVISEFLSSHGPKLLKSLPKHVLKLLAPLVLSALSPLLLHGVDKAKNIRDDLLDKAKGAITSGTDSLLESAVDKVLSAATKDKMKKAKGLRVPLEMKKMLNARSEMILNNL